MKKEEDWSIPGISPAGYLWFSPVDCIPVTTAACSHTSSDLVVTSPLKLLACHYCVSQEEVWAVPLLVEVQTSLSKSEGQVQVLSVAGFRGRGQKPSVLFKHCKSAAAEPCHWFCPFCSEDDVNWSSLFLLDFTVCSPVQFYYSQIQFHPQTDRGRQ